MMTLLARLFEEDEVGVARGQVRQTAEPAQAVLDLDLRDADRLALRRVRVANRLHLRHDEDDHAADDREDAADPAGGRRGEKGAGKGGGSCRARHAGGRTAAVARQHSYVWPRRRRDAAREVLARPTEGMPCTVSAGGRARARARRRRPGRTAAMPQ